MDKVNQVLKLFGHELKPAPIDRSKLIKGMRKANLYMERKLAGFLVEDENGYSFTNNQEYLQSGSKPVSLTLPLESEPYYSKTMIPVFDGLIPEGWLLDIAEKNWKLNERDRM